MRIAITTDYYWPHLGGGVEVVAREVAERLVQRGHEVSVLTLRTKGGPKEDWLNGVQVVRLPAVELTRFVSLQSAIPLNPLGVHAWLRRLKPDILHVNSRFFATSFLAMLFKDQIPTVLTLHLGPVRLGKAIRFYERVIARWLLRRASYVTAVSAFAQEVWPSAALISNGVDTEQFTLRNRCANSQFTVIMVGRLVKNKGPQKLLECVPLLHPDIRVLFVGDGPMRNYLDYRAKELQVADRVRFLGARTDVPDLFARSHLCARLSDTEGMSLSVLEALASGVPVVASPASAGELIVEGSNGIRLKSDSPKELAERINHLCDDRSRLEAMTSNARRTAEQFSWERAVDQYENIYRATVNSGGVK